MATVATGLGYFWKFLSCDLGIRHHTLTLVQGSTGREKEKKEEEEKEPGRERGVEDEKESSKLPITSGCSRQSTHKSVCFSLYVKETSHVNNFSHRIY